MVFNTPFTNIIIDGNTFDYGTYTPDGNPASTPIKYGYFYCIVVTGNTIITNNSFSGTNVATNTSSTQQVALNGGSSIVKNNLFSRGATSIYAYITSGIATDQIITDNVFDSNTVDGTDENIVKGINATPSGLSVGSIYTNNKNQTGYYLLPILSGEKNWDGDLQNFNADNGSSLGGTNALTAGSSIYAEALLADLDLHQYIRAFDISKVIPVGVQILEIRQGIWSNFTGDVFNYTFNGTAGLNNTSFSLTINSGLIDYNAIIDANIQANAGSFGIADSESITFSVVDSTTQSDIENGTYYLVIDTAIQSKPQFYTNTLQSSFIIGAQYLMELGTDNNVAKSIFFSPIRIKYRW